MIREASADDVPTMIHMARQFHASSLYSKWSGFSERAVRDLLHMLIMGGDSSAVFVLDDLQGAIGLMVHPSHISGELMAVEFFWWVNPEARGRGLALLERAEEWARHAGAVRLAMIAPEDADGVHKIYTRRGYMPVERQFVKDL